MAGLSGGRRLLIYFVGAAALLGVADLGGLFGLNLSHFRGNQTGPLRGIVSAAAMLAPAIISLELGLQVRREVRQPFSVPLVAIIVNSLQAAERERALADLVHREVATWEGQAEVQQVDVTQSGERIAVHITIQSTEPAAREGIERLSQAVRTRLGMDASVHVTVVPVAVFHFAPGGS